jgi:YesN/AraC family two-component response regulator
MNTPRPPEGTPMQIRLLIVDDEPHVLAALQRALRLHFGQRLQITLQANAMAALRLVRATPFDVVVSDMRMPAMDGLSFLERVAQLQPRAVRMILTGSADFETAQRAINEVGLFRYLTKPWHDLELASHLEAAIERAAEAARQRQGTLSAQEIERQRLEALEPGITQVEWGPGGEVLMPSLDGELGGGSR